MNNIASAIMPEGYEAPDPGAKPDSTGTSGTAELPDQPGVIFQDDPMLVLFLRYLDPSDSEDSDDDGDGYDPPDSKTHFGFEVMDRLMAP